MSTDRAPEFAIRLPGLRDDLQRLDDRARELAAAWSPRMLAATTIGRERALLRLLGVSGLDASGLPLAGSVVDHYVEGSRDRLAAGVSLPFALALVEYDVAPQRLAIDVASGLVDLVREAELLSDGEAHRQAEAALVSIVAGAVARMDANRTARRELGAVLGEPPAPWISTVLAEPDAGSAAGEARLLARAGFDVLRVDVPVGREWSGLLEAEGRDVDRWRPRAIGPRNIAEMSDVDLASDDNAPAGSQRGLAEIRTAIDEAAATRRAYIRLASAAPPLAAPEQAVVAAFERIDIVFADVMTEIVANGVDPDRALADHAFAATVHRRAGTVVAVGPGPLVVGPDLTSGQPSDAATRSGRALALQLLGIHTARAAGLRPQQIVVGAVPEFLSAEPSGAALALAEVAVRRHLLPEHALHFSADGREGGIDVAALLRVSGVLSHDATAFLHVGAPAPGDREDAATIARAALSTGALLARSRSGAELHGVALEHAARVATAAVRALDGLAADGWRSILGDGFDDPHRRRYGAEAVTERSEANDPLGPG